MRETMRNSPIEKAARKKEGSLARHLTEVCTVLCIEGRQLLIVIGGVKRDSECLVFCSLMPVLL